MATIQFYEVDSDTFEDFPIGTVTIENDKITASNEDLSEIVESMVGTGAQALEFFESWSNGYIRSVVV